MDAWIDLARGPLFRLALLACVLGLGFRLITMLGSLALAWRRAEDHDMPRRAIARATARWLFPVRLLRARPIYSVASVVFHAAILLVPLFSLGHVTLWQGSPPWRMWPVLPPALADALALAGLVAVAAILLARSATTTNRALSKAGDMGVLGALLAVLATGLLAAHPTWLPLDARALLLGHLLLADLTLVLVPTTKIAHCILFPFAQLVFEVGWHFPEPTGRHVATVLGKEDERV